MPIDITAYQRYLNNAPESDLEKKVFSILEIMVDNGLDPLSLGDEKVEKIIHEIKQTQIKTNINDGSTTHKPGDLFHDKNNTYQGGYYLLLSYDFEEQINNWAWVVAYFPTFDPIFGFKGAIIKFLFNGDIEKLVLVNRLAKLLK